MPEFELQSRGFILLDTTILSNFALVGVLPLLQQGLQRRGLRPLIPPQVGAEFQRGVEKGLFAADADVDWTEVVKPSSQETAISRKLQGILGQGEASCLAIALERELPMATDDLKARDVARRLGVTVTGTLGILGWAVKAGLISLDEGDNILKAMRKQGYFSPVESLRELLELG